MSKAHVTPQQPSLSQAEYGAKKKRSRRDIFLAKMEQMVPWSRLTAVIEPHYPKSGKRGRLPIGIERMLHMYFIQQWYGLADVAGRRRSLYDSQALRAFCGIGLKVQSVLDVTLIAAPNPSPCGASVSHRQEHLQAQQDPKGMKKNDAQLNVLFALSNVCMVREKLCP